MSCASRVTVLLFAVLLSSAFAGGEITQSRAHQIAAYYFARYFPREGCGGARFPTLRGDYWESIVGIGVAGTPRGTIHIHRYTGRVSYSGPFLLKPSTSAESLERWAAKSR